MIIAASLLSVFGEFLTRHPGLLLVLIGVAGEIVCDWKEMGVGRLARAKRISAILLVIGLMMEFWEAAKSDNEIAKTKERTALVESNNLMLQTNVESLNSAVIQLAHQYDLSTNALAEAKSRLANIKSAKERTMDLLESLNPKAVEQLKNGIKIHLTGNAPIPQYNELWELSKDASISKYIVFTPSSSIIMSANGGQEFPLDIRVLPELAQ
jgi:hypothetical protein